MKSLCNPGHSLDIRFPCPICGVDSGEDCKPVRKLTPFLIAAGYVHFARRVRRLKAQRAWEGRD